MKRKESKKENKVKNGQKDENDKRKQKERGTA